MFYKVLERTVRKYSECNATILFDFVISLLQTLRMLYPLFKQCVPKILDLKTFCDAKNKIENLKKMKMT